ncbi:hypothetical protein Avbf_14130 [Armadillidium vulgare]|nr:hypothetical protein Avbf_14130 [Armadillidium vulgare]
MKAIITNNINIKGGRIDHGLHDTRTHTSLEELLDLDEAVEEAIRMTNTEETLIIVTADHSHVMTMNGYPDRGNDILGIEFVLSVFVSDLATVSVYLSVFVSDLVTVSVSLSVFVSYPIILVRVLILFRVRICVNVRLNIIVRVRICVNVRLNIIVRVRICVNVRLNIIVSVRIHIKIISTIDQNLNHIPYPQICKKYTIGCKTNPEIFLLSNYISF